MSTFTHVVGFGLVTSAVIALSAVALSLQFSVSNIPNFAHGEFLTLGMYGALVTQRLTDNIFVDALGGAAVTAVAAWAINRGIIEPFNRRGAKVTVLFVITIALSLMIQNGLIVFFGGTTQSLVVPSYAVNQVGPFLFTAADEVVMVVAVVIMVALHLVLRYTKFGKAQRAVADSRELASVTGINMPRVVALTWLMAGAIAGLAGVVIAFQGGTFNPLTGYTFLLVTFAAAVAGGLGRPYGAMVGALILGLATEVSGGYLAASYKMVIAVGILVLVLLVKPSGLFGAKEQAAI
ncbi:MAG TPA: branched-chain amino acid ABC transporter permease [Candidatus Saccharimonadales bacterium]|nr:branched-chain amino acid ABC transporter permease [Candidatus Saccharimonadales bacterium]